MDTIVQEHFAAVISRERGSLDLPAIMAQLA
jgi:hypothetical protein